MQLHFDVRGTSQSSSACHALTTLLVGTWLSGCTIEPVDCLILAAGEEEHEVLAETSFQVAESMDMEVLRYVNEVSSSGYPDFFIELKGHGSYVIVNHSVGDPSVCAYGFLSKRPLEVLREFEIRLQSAGISKATAPATQQIDDIDNGSP